MTRTREENAADLARDNARRSRESQIIERVIADALASDPRLHLSVEDVAPTRDAKALLDEVLAVDEARLYYHRNGEPDPYGWVFFVLGNDDGSTVVSDYTTNLEQMLAGANELADNLAGG